MLTYAQAVAEATDQAMELDPNVVVIGQGTRDRGCIFGTVAGLYEKYGPERVIEMPLAESAIMGIALGMAQDGLRPIFVLQRVDFAFLVMDQLINHAAKWRFMFGGQGKAPVTLRLVVGKGWGQGPQHSQSLHALFSHFPGLRVALPSEPDDAKGMLLNSIFSDDPVVFIEGRPLHSRSGPVPEAPYVTPFGEARVLRPGTDATIVAVSLMAPIALAAADKLATEGVSTEVIDVRSTSPLDMRNITDSVARTGRLIVADSSWQPFGLGSEIAAAVGEKLFGRLRAPIRRVSYPFHPVPTARVFEQAFYPDAERLCAEVRGLIHG